MKMFGLMLATSSLSLSSGAASAAYFYDVAVSGYHQGVVVGAPLSGDFSISSQYCAGKITPYSCNFGYSRDQSTLSAAFGPILAYSQISESSFTTPGIYDVLTVALLSDSGFIYDLTTDLGRFVVISDSSITNAGRVLGTYCYNTFARSCSLSYDGESDQLSFSSGVISGTTTFSGDTLSTQGTFVSGTNTLRVTSVGQTFGALDASVPEPATWAMMTLGFGAVGFAMRRKKVGTRIRFA